jgi:hypothetical protein
MIRTPTLCLSFLIAQLVGGAHLAQASWLLVGQPALTGGPLQRHFLMDSPLRLAYMNTVPATLFVCAASQSWINKEHVIGRSKGYLPYIGMVTIIMNDYPIVKYVLVGVMGLFVLTTRE